MQNANIFIRFVAFYIDLAISWVIAIISTIIFMPINLETLSRLPYVYIFSILFIFKDVAGRSPGKWLLKLRLVSKDGETPPVWKRIVRNLTIYIWPVEAIAAFNSPSGTRLADKYLGINVVKYNKLLSEKIKKR